MKIFRILFALALLISTSAKGQTFESRATTISLNGIPAVCDSTEGKIYFTLGAVSAKKSGEAPYRLFFSTTDSNDSLWINGQLLSDTLQLKDICDNTYTLEHLTAKGIRSNWKICFTTLPIVCMECNPERMEILFKNDATRDTKVPAYVTIIDPEGRTNDSITVFHNTAEMRYRGATASGFDKKSFNIELTDSTGEEYDANILGLRHDGDWIMDAMYVDHARMRNRVITDIWNSIDDLPWEKDNGYQANGTSGYFVEAFLNGRYHGLYCFTDKIDRKKLNLKKTKYDIDNIATARGILYKARKWTGATYLSDYEAAPTDTLYWEGWEQKYPDDTPTSGYWSPLQELIDAIDDDSNEELFAQRIQELCYTENLINYAILVTIFHCSDNVMKNSYACIRNTQKEKRILFTPWDLDASFGRGHNGKDKTDDPRLWAFGYQCPGMCALFNRLLCQKYKPHLWFKKMFRDRWNELRDSALSPDTVKSRLTAYADLFTTSGAWARECERWTTLDEDEKGKDKHVALGDIYSEVEFMMSFYNKNYNIFEDFIKDWPVTPTEIKTVEELQSKVEVSVSGNTLTIKTNKADATATIFNADGSSITTLETLPAHTILDRGIYFIRITSATGTTIRKAVIR